jgi:hypothetical protein
VPLRLWVELQQRLNLRRHRRATGSSPSKSGIPRRGLLSAKLPARPPSLELFPGAQLPDVRRWFWRGPDRTNPAQAA